MRRGALTIVPILIGAGAGAALALMQARSHGPAARPADAPQPKTVTAMPVVADSGRSGSEPSGSALAGATQAATSESAAPGADAAQPGAAAPASNRGIPGTPPSATLDAKNGAPQAQPSPGLAPAPNLSIPTSAQEQLQAEVRCNAQVAEACESAALSVEQGLFGTKDLKRATMLRRIALTLYVKQCEGGRPSSCEQLARMYERGDLKLPNPRTVQALAQRIHELCQKHGEDPVCANPRPIPP